MLPWVHVLYLHGEREVFPANTHGALRYSHLARLRLSHSFPTTHEGVLERDFVLRMFGAQLELELELSCVSSRSRCRLNVKVAKVTAATLRTSNPCHRQASSGDDRSRCPARAATDFRCSRDGPDDSGLDCVGVWIKHRVLALTSCSPACTVGKETEKKLWFVRDADASVGYMDSVCRGCVRTLVHGRHTRLGPQGGTHTRCVYHSLGLQNVQ